MTEEVPRRILVVEDDALLAMFVEQMVEDLGHEVVGPAMTLASALSLATSAAFDCAILDMNLGRGHLSTPVARVLANRGIPFVFATGNGDRHPIEEYRGVAILNKPFMTEDLREVLLRVL